MEGDPSDSQEIEDMEEGLDTKMPLEGGIVPLEDVEESEKSNTTATLVGKIICVKNLNKGVVKQIMNRAWEEIANMTIIDINYNTFTFNFHDEGTRRIMEEGPWIIMGQLLSL